MQKSRVPNDWGVLGNSHRRLCALSMDYYIVHSIAGVMDNSIPCFQYISSLSGIYQKNWKNKNGGKICEGSKEVLETTL